jgi:CRP/FNR family transcriptional regulator, cyclic AMP receptor protein
MMSSNQPMRIVDRAPAPDQNGTPESARPVTSSSDVTGSAQERWRLLARFERTFRAGSVLFQEGAAAREAFLLQEGRVRLLRRIGMAERSLALVKPGDLFGEGALLPETTHGSTAVALTDGLALALDRTTFRGLIEPHPEVALRAIDHLVRRLREAEDQIEILMLRGVKAKVASALLKLAGQASGASEIVISPVELSTRVGLDVETVKRTVAKLRERQYLRISGERIEIPDVEALRRLYVLLGVEDELAGS